MAFTTVSLADIKVSLKRKYEGVRFYTDEEVRLAFNEALREWNLWTGRWRRTILLPITGNTWEYNLGATITYAAAVRHLDVPLNNCSTADLELGHPSWRLETIASGGDVPTRPTYWAPLSLQQIIIWPALAVDGGNISVEGVSNTPVLTEEADTVDIGEETIDVLVDYSLHVMSFKQSGPMWVATLPYWKALLQAAAKENGRLKANQKFRRAAGLNRRRDLLPTQNAPTQMDVLAERGGVA